MSVYSGRKQRQLLYDPEMALYNFQVTEGTAMPVTHRNDIQKTLITLLIITLTGACTTIAIYNSNETFMYVGFFSLFIIAIIFISRGLSLICR